MNRTGRHGNICETLDGENINRTRAVVVALNDYFPESTGMKQIRIWKPEKRKMHVFWKERVKQLSGMNERIRSDGCLKTPDGNACTVCKESVGEINLPDRTLTMENGWRNMKIIWTGRKKLIWIYLSSFADSFSCL